MQVCPIDLSVHWPLQIEDSQDVTVTNQIAVISCAFGNRLKLKYLSAIDISELEVGRDSQTWPWSDPLGDQTWSQLFHSARSIVP